MTYAGAREETEDQMARTLHFSLPQPSLHPAFNALDLTLAGRGARTHSETAEGARPEPAEGANENPAFRLNIINALWGQAGYQFLAPFLDTLAENYGAGLRLLDFAAAPDQSRLAINEWVSEQTETRITDLIPAGAIDALTRLVLTNAIYFNAAWAKPFQAGNTADGLFYPAPGARPELADGEPLTVPMMRQTESFRYAAMAGLSAVELPYKDRKLAMLILLPDEGNQAVVEETLDADLLEEILGALAPRRIELTMPRFEFSAEFMLKPVLAAMGMPDAFTEAADFSGMDGGLTLQIADVIHKAFVDVDEAGTEAAAATAVIMMTRAMPRFEEPLQLTLDRPFLFLIRDMPTGTILFSGRLADPG